MSSVAGECGVVGWLVHISLLVEVEGFPGALPLAYLLVGLFPAALTPIRACDRSRSSNLINAISGRGTKGAPNLSRRTRRAFGAG
jgi:hypothetical protein